MLTYLERSLGQFLHKLLRSGGALLFLMLFHSVCAFAQDAETGTGGGSGLFGSASTYKLDCGTKKALVGISGRSGDYIDYIRGICAEVADDGSWKGSTPPTSSTGNLLGGTKSFELKCPSGWAISAISGRAGSFVHEIKIECRRLDGQGHTTQEITEKSHPNAKGAITDVPTFGPLWCPDNKPAKALKGRSGSFIDSIGLVCNYPDISPPTRYTIRGETLYALWSFAREQGFKIEGTKLGTDGLRCKVLTAEVKAEPFSGNKVLQLYDGVKCSFDLFKGKKLKSGWKMVSIRGTGATSYGGPSWCSRSVSWLKLPTGNDDPHVILLVEHGGGMGCVETVVYIQEIVLEGPANADWRDAFRP